MSFSLFSFWDGEVYIGFSFFEIDPFREDGKFFALLGASYDIEDKIISIDLFWMEFEIHLKKKEPIKFDFDE